MKKKVRGETENRKLFSMRLSSHEISEIRELRAMLGGAARRDGIARVYTLTSTINTAIETLARQLRDNGLGGGGAVSSIVNERAPRKGPSRRAKARTGASRFPIVS